MSIPNGFGAPPNAGLWSGLGNATVFENGTYFTAGIYDVEIVRCVSKHTQKSGLGFIVETEVLSSSNLENPVGTKRTWYQSMKNLNVGFGAVAAFLLAAFDLNNTAERKTDFFPYLESFIRRVDGPENILSGFFLHLECTMIKTREKQSDFTRHDWSPFDYESFNLKQPRWEQYRGTGLIVPSNGWQPPPGAQMSPDGRMYWAPGMAGWANVPA